MTIKNNIVRLVVVCSMLGLASAEGYKRVCYYSNWSQYRPGNGKFLPEHIDPSLCTHLIYSFAKLDDNHELTTYEWNDLTLYKTFNALKDGRDIKTLLAVGGWNAGSKIFSNMVSNPYLRQKFASQSVDFIVANGFDGLDMDWEYPANRGGAQTDKVNFIHLLKEIRTAMKNSNQSHLLLTAAVSAGKSTIDTAYDIPGMAKNLDFINLMSYDLHGGWESFTGHNSPLYSRSSENSEQKMLNVDWAANYWVTQGTPPEKLIIGLATYGRHFKLSDSTNHAMGAATSGSGDRGPMTAEAGFLAYYEVCAMLVSGAKTYWHEEHKVPYLVLGDQWVGYDDEMSFTIKLEYIIEHSYGGAMIWNIDLDDFNQQCSLSDRKYPLMSLMKEILDDYIPTTRNPVTGGPTSVVTTMVTAETVTPIVTDRPTTSQTDAPTGPPGEFTCAGKKDGMYADPDDCSAFYNCAHGKKYHNQCPTGLLWNPERNYCDYPRNVYCSSATTELPTTEPTTQPPTKEPTTQPPTKEPTTQPPTKEPTTQPPTKEPTTQPPTKEPTTQPTTTAAETEAPTNPPTTTDFCANKDAGLYKNVNDCQSFYHCVHHNTYIKHCSPGTLFNAKAKICDWKDNVNCDEKEPETNFCAGLMAGLYPFPEDCSKYYKCGGTSETAVLACPHSTYYSATLGSCDLAYNVNCDGRPELDDENVPKDICAAKGDGLHSDPKSCHDYIQCARGVKYPRTCGGYLVFNPNSKVCDWPNRVDC